MSDITVLETYHTIPQVAERLHKTPAAVSKWLSRGLLKRTKAGGSTLISETDLQDFIRRSTEQAKAA